MCSKNLSYYDYYHSLDSGSWLFCMFFSFLHVLLFSISVFSHPTQRQLKDMADLFRMWGNFKVLATQNHDKSQTHVMQWAWHILKVLTGPFKGPSGFPLQHWGSFLLFPTPGVNNLSSQPSTELSYLPSSLWGMVPPFLLGPRITSVGFWLRLYHLHQNNLGYLFKCRFLDHTCIFLNLSRYLTTGPKIWES